MHLFCRFQPSLAEWPDDPSSIGIVILTLFQPFQQG
jgi:hypothetical protein